MDLWFLHNSNVLHREREAFDTLKKNSAWLSALDWTIEDQQLCVHVAISVAGVEYKAKLIYPIHFPDAPPIVLPQSPQRRWSTHQYGENGSLCLEWGPDNWISSVTGAQMVSSMHKLLSTENFADTVQSNEQRIIAPSRHFLEVGQELRGRCFRFLITKPLMEYLNTKVNSKVLKYTIRYSLNWLLPDALLYC